MMYTTAPIVDQYWDVHLGFYVIMAICAFIMAIVITMRAKDECETPTIFVWLTALTAILYIAHDASYQPQKHYVNTPVIGKFVQYQAEAYSERSGKQMVDRHYMYVVYEIDGSYTTFQTYPGSVWPKQAQFYRNPTK